MEMLLLRGQCAEVPHGVRRGYMKTRLINFWEFLRASFWFIPALMLVLSFIMSFNMVTIDRYIEVRCEGIFLISCTVSPEGARAILSTIAGSMITVAGVTFSITIVVLNLASSQFGPRLLRNFMQDRGIQFVLGTFVATFIYCLLVLRAVQVGGLTTFVPSLSVTLAVVLALFNVGVLIYFIHHVATSIHADEVVFNIGKELERNARRIFASKEIGEGDASAMQTTGGQDLAVDHYYTHRITARRNGYLQAIDFNTLFMIAKENDYRLDLQVRPGSFVAKNSVLAIALGKEIFDVGLSDSITGAFIVGDQRTPEQDIEYSINQLVEVAVRSLSPGINDPYTALACIDQLGSALCYYAKQKFPSSSAYDEQGNVRLKMRSFTFPGTLNASLDQIRQYGCTSVAVSIRLLEVLGMIAMQTRHSDQRKAILRQGDMILHASQEVLLEQNDKEDVLERYHLLLSVLHEFADQDEQ